MTTSKKPFDPRSIRKALGLNQQDFWSRIGVTQSGGSRYESGRNMPKPVQELLRVVHVEGIDLAQIQRNDLQIINHLRLNKPELYDRLLEEALSE
ncbi:helix-turn-helix domain-containing protein [Chitinilyticum piscinae]|uniref:Helix-turn-helix transcriptional regulator n=1 Tax=Chitinilyticum piscinae TaxID=2866724 RepID=A0A8J7FIC1_9NEIS|nr:helix-turn-helix transcriptional regulator [Chitinilyticum piscinae]MBE9609835.1 helix-turn-helix transcriptional regulator [Chitinilyticum piscinae]